MKQCNGGDEKTKMEQQPNQYIESIGAETTQ